MTGFKATDTDFVDLDLYMLLSDTETIVPDEYAAPSDIAWRIEEIVYQTGHLEGEERVRSKAWLAENIDHLLLVERGGL